LVALSQRLLVGTGGGTVHVIWLHQYEDVSDWKGDEHETEWYWRGLEFGWPELQVSGSTGATTDITYWLKFPYWLLLALAAPPTIALFLWTRPRRVGECPRCKYNLTGNTSGVCSECGLTFAICTECGHVVTTTPAATGLIHSTNSTEKA